MRQALVALLGTCLLTATPGSVVGQAPSPEPADAGLTMQLGLLHEPWSVVAAQFPLGWRHLGNKLPDYGEVAYNLWAEEWCELATATLGPAHPQSAEAYADAWVSHYGDSYKDISRSVVNLPAGRAQRIDYMHSSDTDGVRYGTLYALVESGELLHLACAGDAVPPDNWRQIAESLTIGPGLLNRVWPAITGESTGYRLRVRDFDPRVAMPTFGFSIEFPAEWWVDPAGITKDQPEDDPVTTVIVAQHKVAESNVAVCSVVDYTSVATAEGWTTIEGIAAGRPDGEMELLDLPAGRMGRVQRTLEDGTTMTDYKLTDGHRWFGMECHATDGPPPADRWLSIVETIEFLPAED